MLQRGCRQRYCAGTASTAEALAIHCGEADATGQVSTANTRAMVVLGPGARVSVIPPSTCAVQLGTMLVPNARPQC
jgi:hypothetical protein